MAMKKTTQGRRYTKRNSVKRRMSGKTTRRRVIPRNSRKKTKSRRLGRMEAPKPQRPMQKRSRY